MMKVIFETCRAYLIRYIDIYASITFCILLIHCGIYKGILCMHVEVIEVVWGYGV